MTTHLISRLPYRQRNAVRARQDAGLGYAEIARLLRCTLPEAVSLVEEGERTLRGLIDRESSSMSDEVSRAADELAAECPVRICPSLHQTGDYQHYRLPNGRLRCFGRGVDVPDGSTASDAQRRLWSAQQRGEADE